MSYYNKKNWFISVLDALPEWTEVQLVSKPANLQEYVIPLFRFLHRIFLSPYYIVYDKETQLCSKSSSSIPRKILCGIIQVFVILQLIAFASGNPESRSRTDVKLGLVRTMQWLLIVVFHGSLYQILWMKMDLVAKLLNKIQLLSVQLKYCSNCKLSSKSKIRLYSWGLISAYAIFSVCVFIFMNEVEHIPNLLNYGFYSALEASATKGLQSLCAATFAFRFGMDHFEHQNSTYMIYIVGILYPIFNYFLALTWIFNNLVLVLWAKLFTSLYDLYFETLKENDSHALKDMMVFNKITCILSDFNQIFNFNILIGVLATICYISNSIWSVFQLDEDDLDAMAKLIQFGSFIVYVFKLLAASQVNQKASEMVSRIKINLKEEEMWNAQCPRTLEAMMTIFYDLQSASVGFRGLNYFTLTFSFVGGICSLIVTYSIVVLQFNTEKNAGN